MALFGPRLLPVVLAIAVAGIPPTAAAPANAEAQCDGAHPVYGLIFDYFNVMGTQGDYSSSCTVYTQAAIVFVEQQSNGVCVIDFDIVLIASGPFLYSYSFGDTPYGVTYGGAEKGPFYMEAHGQMWIAPGETGGVLSSAANDSLWLGQADSASSGGSVYCPEMP